MLFGQYINIKNELKTTLKMGVNMREKMKTKK